jgi:hypothetical protein
MVERRNENRGVKSALSWLAAAGLIGSAAGVGSVALTDEGREEVVETAREVGASSGLVRRRAPQSGDYWRYCREAREAGTAPIYAGEPGYRAPLDRDGDGVACEPYRGY